MRTFTFLWGIFSLLVAVQWAESSPAPDPLDTININLNLEEEPGWRPKPTWKQKMGSRDYETRLPIDYECLFGNCNKGLPIDYCFQTDDCYLKGLYSSGGFVCINNKCESQPECLFGNCNRGISQGEVVVPILPIDYCIQTDDCYGKGLYSSGGFVCKNNKCESQPECLFGNCNRGISQGEVVAPILPIDYCIQTDDCYGKGLYSSGGFVCRNNKCESQPECLFGNCNRGLPIKYCIRTEDCNGGFVYGGIIYGGFVCINNKCESQPECFFGNCNRDYEEDGKDVSTDVPEPEPETEPKTESTTEPETENGNKEDINDVNYNTNARSGKINGHQHLKQAPLTYKLYILNELDKIVDGEWFLQSGDSEKFVIAQNADYRSENVHSPIIKIVAYYEEPGQQPTYCEPYSKPEGTTEDKYIIQGGHGNCVVKEPSVP